MLMDVTFYLRYVTVGRNLLGLSVAWRGTEQKYTFLYSLYIASEKYLNSSQIYLFQSDWQEILAEIKRRNNEGVIWSFKIGTSSIRMSFWTKVYLCN